MLGGFALLLPYGSHDGDEGRMDEHDVLLSSEVPPELSRSLQEGHGFDVPHGPSQFHNGHVRPGLSGDRRYPPLYLIRDVGDYLDGLPEILPSPLVLDDGPVDLPRGDVVVHSKMEVHEPLVVPEVEIHFPAVVQDIHLPVFERVHGPCVDVEVGVDLDGCHVDASRLEKTPYGRCGDPLSQSGYYSSADENQFHVKSTGTSLSINR